MPRQIRSTSTENRPSTRQQQNPRTHRENFKSRRLQRHDANSRAAPLPQVLDEEESVENIHRIGGLIENEHAALREKLASHIESLLFGMGQP
jgi:hypothetical protein